MNDSTRRYLVAYDIKDDKRRGRTSKCLQSYGRRIQYSTFLVDLRPARLQRLAMQLGKTIESKVDSVLICDLGLVKGAKSGRMVYLGVHNTDEGDKPLVV